MLNTLSLDTWLLIGASIALFVMMACVVVDTVLNLVKTIHCCTSKLQVRAGRSPGPTHLNHLGFGDFYLRTPFWAWKTQALLSGP